jgi:hypothetical protein
MTLLKRIQMLTQKYWYLTNKNVHGNKHSRNWKFYGGFWYAQNARASHIMHFQGSHDVMAQDEHRIFK